LPGRPTSATSATWLVENSFTNAGVEALLASPHLTGLQRLSVSEGDLGTALVAALRRRFPR